MKPKHVSEETVKIKIILNTFVSWSKSNLSKTTRAKSLAGLDGSASNSVRNVDFP